MKKVRFKFRKGSVVEQKTTGQRVVVKKRIRTLKSKCDECSPPRLKPGTVWIFGAPHVCEEETKIEREEGQYVIQFGLFSETTKTVDKETLEKYFKKTK
jgi:hypothetical protein